MVQRRKQIVSLVHPFRTSAKIPPILVQLLQRYLFFYFFIIFISNNPLTNDFCSNYCCTKSTDCSDGAWTVVVHGLAYAPNFITKIIEEQTSIRPFDLHIKPSIAVATTTTTDQSQQQQQAFTTTPLLSNAVLLENEHDSDNRFDSSTTTTTTTMATIDTVESSTEQVLTTMTSKNSIVKTRFPPEPNGYLHLGHAKAITFNFAVAKAFYCTCNMRLDDTNPSKEDSEYVNAILQDVIWILSDTTTTTTTTTSAMTTTTTPSTTTSIVPPWDGPVRKTSDYFDQIYECAMELIKSGDAYVDSLSAEQMKEYRGTLTQPGIDSPYRTRTIEENIQLFTNMKNGIYPDGTHVVRAKIDMKSNNINLRDPTLYRIKHESHQETGTKWCIYPMYDFSHPISDAIEQITYSLCTLEFEDHRPFYDWTLLKLVSNPNIDYIDNTIVPLPQQIEFSRLNIKSTVLSKRKLIQLVNEQYVSGWDDPRMPTICGLRRRGIPPEAIRMFCERMGISKADSFIDYNTFEECIRDVMDNQCPRAFGVFEPLKVTITNMENIAQDTTTTSNNKNEVFVVDKHPKHSSMGQRSIPFSDTIYIERSDFFDTTGPEGVPTNQKPPKGFKRLLLNGCVRLRYAYVIQCNEIVRDSVTNEPIELKCTYYPETRAGVTPDGMNRVNGIIHWVDSNTCIKCTVNQYDRLFTVDEPGKGHDDGNFLLDLNPNSLQIQHNVLIEQSVANEAYELVQKIKKQQEAEQKKNEKDIVVNGNHNTLDHSSSSSYNNIQLYPAMLSYQFERSGYYALDKSSIDDSTNQLIFNRVVTLRDTWGVSTTNKQDTATTMLSSSSSSVPTSLQPPRRRGGGVSKQQTTEAMNSEKNDDDHTTTATTVVEDLRRVLFQVVTIVGAKQHPDAESLLVCTIDCSGVNSNNNNDDDTSKNDESSSNTNTRTVVAGLAGKIPIEQLVGQKVVAVTNIKPSKMRGIESTAMLLAATAATKSSSISATTTTTTTNDNNNPGNTSNSDDVASIVELLSVPESVPNGEILFFNGIDPSPPNLPLLKSKGAIKVLERVISGLQSNKVGQVIYVNDSPSSSFATTICSSNDKKEEEDARALEQESVPTWYTMTSSGGPITTKSLRNASIR